MDSVNTSQRIVVVAFLIIGLLILMLILGDHFRVKVPRIGRSKQVVFEISRDKIRVLQLRNGMKVIVYQDAAVPKVLVRVCYDVGASVEQSYERGLAHLVEHMIFKGTQKLSETDINVIARKYGAAASYNASTSQDYTTYYFETDKENWKHFIPIMADCMQNALFDEQHLASELKTVVQEFNRGQDDHIRKMFLKAFELVFPPNHPYHFPTIGFKEELANLTSAELKDFYHRYYHPGRAALFIMGDVDLEEALTLAKNNFEDIQANETEVAIDFPPVLQSLESISYSFYQDVKNEELCFFWRIPGSKEGTDHLYDLLLNILCQGHDSLLYKRLVDKEMVADRVMHSVWQYKEAGIVFIVVTPKAGMAEKCEQFLKDEFKKLVTNGLPQEELSKRVPNMARSFIEVMQHFVPMSYAWMDFYFSRKKVFEFFSYVENLYAAKALDLEQILKDHLSVDFIKKIHLLPLPSDKRVIWDQNSKIIRAQEENILLNHERTTTIEQPRYVHEMPDAKIFEVEMPMPTLVQELNGLKVILYKDTRFPIVDLCLRFRDSEYFKYSIQGLCLDLMMGMLLEGSVGYSKQDHLDFFASMGADVNFSKAGVFCKVLDSNVLPVLDRIFYIIKNPTFRREIFDKRKELLLSQIQRRQNSQHDIAMVYFWRNVFKDTEFDFGFEAMTSFVQNLSLKDIVSMHSMLNPYAVILGISGKINLETALANLDKVTKNWNQSVPYEAKVMSKPKLDQLENSDLQMLRDQVLLFYGAPSEINNLTAELPLIILANLMIFQGLGSRMYNVREQTGLFYGLSGCFAGATSNLFSLNYVMTLLSLQKLGEAESLIKGVLETAVNDGFSDEEIRAAQQTYANLLVNLYCYNAPIINTFVELAIVDLPFDFYKQMWAKIKDADSDKIKYALQKHINLDDFRRIRVGNFRT